MPQHLALPLRLASDGRFAALDQDTPEEVAQSVALLLATRPGERRSVPGFGMVDPLGAGLDPSAVADAIEEWEDRADPADVDLSDVSLTEQYATVAAATVSTAAATDEEA